MNPKELNNLLINEIEAVVCYLLPNGSHKGREWHVGSISGEEGNSLRVCLEGPKKGIFCDFATGDKGDLLSLWQQVKKLTFVETLKEVRSYLGLVEDRPFKEKKHNLPAKPKCQKPTEKMINWWENCGISSSTLEKLKICQQGNAIVFPYLSPSGDLELVKYRDIDEKKFWSNKDPIPCLFGWQAINDNDRNIVIAEGEKDCATFWQQNIPALSVPKGAGGGGKQDWIEYEFERLERFEEIFICMDSDEAGQEAVIEILDRLGRHRCKVVNLQYLSHKYKDPNEVHLDGLNLIDFLNTAKTIDPEELKKLSEFHREILKEMDPERQKAEGTKLPWRKSQDEVRLRKAEVSVFAGINSHGKSVLISQVMIDSVAQGDRWCIASMEMPAKKLGAKVYAQAGGVQHPTEEYAEKIKQLIDKNIYIFTAYGTTKAKKIMEVFEYARRRYGVNHFCIDSLAKCGFAEDDFKSQKAFVDELFEYALINNIHMSLVVHMRKGESEEKPPGKFDVKGTGGITDMVNNVFIVWRNKKKERLLKSGDSEEQKKALSHPDTVLYCVKQRETGVEPSYSLWFHPQSNQFLEYSGAEPKRYVMT